MGMAAQDPKRGVGAKPRAGFLAKLAFQGPRDGLAWLKAPSRWPPVAAIGVEPDHHAGIADERHDVDARDQCGVDLAGKQQEVHIDRRPGDLGRAK